MCRLIRTRITRISRSYTYAVTLIDDHTPLVHDPITQIEMQKLLNWDACSQSFGAWRNSETCEVRDRARRRRASVLIRQLCQVWLFESLRLCGLFEFAVSLAVIDQLQKPNILKFM